MSERSTLERRWLDLTRRDLPAAAQTRGWPIRLDHCFQRVLLDNAFGGRWYDHVAGRPAYRTAPDDALARAVMLGEGALAGEQDMEALNARSLGWRGKRNGRPDAA